MTYDRVGEIHGKRCRNSSESHGLKEVGLANRRSGGGHGQEKINRSDGLLLMHNGDRNVFVVVVVAT